MSNERYRSPFNPMNKLQPWVEPDFDDREEASAGMKARLRPLYDQIEEAALQIMDIGEEYGCNHVHMVTDDSSLEITITRREE